MDLEEMMRRPTAPEEPPVGGMARVVRAVREIVREQVAEEIAKRERARHPEPTSFRPPKGDPVDQLLIEAVRVILERTAAMIANHERDWHGATPQAGRKPSGLRSAARGTIPFSGPSV